MVILRCVKEKGIFDGKEVLFVEDVEGDGFSMQKRGNKLYVHEQCNIIEQRHTYLQTIKKIIQENRTIIYAEETWVNVHHTQAYIGVDSDRK